MSIKTTLAWFRIWPWPEVRVHVFRSMHDGRVYVIIGGDVQIFPPARAMNRRTGLISQRRWDRHYYHDPKPVHECNCWRCTMLARRSA